MLKTVFQYMNSLHGLIAGAVLVGIVGLVGLLFDTRFDGRFATSGTFYLNPGEASTAFYPGSRRAQGGCYNVIISNTNPGSVQLHAAVGDQWFPVDWAEINYAYPQQAFYISATEPVAFVFDMTFRGTFDCDLKIDPTVNRVARASRLIF